MPTQSRHLTPLRCFSRLQWRYLLFAYLLLGIATQASCASQLPALKPTASPFPTFDLSELPPPLGGESTTTAIAPLEVQTYLTEVAAYANSSIIAAAPQFSVQQLDGIVAALEAISVPPEMILAHEKLLKGYLTMVEGRRIQVDNIGDGEQQAEARSLTDFGQLLLQEHIQIVNAYLVSLRATPVP